MTGAPESCWCQNSRIRLTRTTSNLVRLPHWLHRQRVPASGAAGVVTGPPGSAVGRAPGYESARLLLLSVGQPTVEP